MYGGAYGQYSAAVLPEGFPVIAFPDRSECEKSLSRDHHHMTLTNLLGFDFPEACQRFAIADFVKPGPRRQPRLLVTAGGHRIQHARLVRSDAGNNLARRPMQGRRRNAASLAPLHPLVRLGPVLGYLPLSVVVSPRRRRRLEWRRSAGARRGVRLDSVAAIPVPPQKFVAVSFFHGVLFPP